ncbi:hypothetical protein HAX54_000243 [Datura stramonium]|uniref:Uncharacterized protein n=1 Tax=Datura stramonium TaxID=4076 RepID=A0ABS8WPS6_DATST|nr:hypothetical protein [Datura stramonium]
MDGETNWSDTFTLDSEFHYIPGYWEWVKEVLSRSAKALKDAKVYDAIYGSLLLMIQMVQLIPLSPDTLVRVLSGILTKGTQENVFTEEEVPFGTQQWLIGLICTTTVMMTLTRSLNRLLYECWLQKLDSGLTEDHALSIKEEVQVIIEDMDGMGVDISPLKNFLESFFGLVTSYDQKRSTLADMATAVEKSESFLRAK